MIVKKKVSLRRLMPFSEPDRWQWISGTILLCRGEDLATGIAKSFAWSILGPLKIRNYVPTVRGVRGFNASISSIPGRHEESWRKPGIRDAICQDSLKGSESIAARDASEVRSSTSSSRGETTSGESTPDWELLQRWVDTIVGRPPQDEDNLHISESITRIPNPV